MIRALLTALAVTLSVGVALPAQAKRAKHPSEERAESAYSGEAITRSFNELGTPREPLRLNTWSANYTVKLPLSPREAIRDALLHLDTVNSTALIRSRSELSIRVNGRVLAQYALDPERTRMSNEVRIPADLLKTGYNDVTIGVVQHYTYDCEDPGSPELWTEIDPLRSSITVNYAGLRPNLTPRLTQLHTAFDRRAWAPLPLAVVVGTEQVNKSQLSAAAVAVQGIALRKGYRPVSVDVFNANTAVALRPQDGRFGKLNPAVTEGHDLLLIGKRAELSRYLDTEVAGVMNGPFVGVFSLNEGATVALVVSGNTDEELMQAARAVGNPDYKFSDVPMEQVNQKTQFVQPFTAQPKEATPFYKFDYNTTSARGIKVQPVTVEFRAPSDFGAQKGEVAQVKLHFSYGAGLRKDSAMSLYLNGKFAVSVPLNEINGGEFTGYSVNLPAQFIKPGYNVLTFEPVFLSQKERCDMLRDEHMVLTIYEDSTLELPASTVSPKVPDLERFSAGLWSLDSGARVYVTANDVATSAAALEVVALMAQKNRAPFDVEASFEPFNEGHMFVVGPYGGLAQFVADALPLRKYSWSAEGQHVGMLQAAEGKRAITALLGSDAQALKRSVYALGKKGLWNELTGAAVVIDTEENTLKAEPAREQVQFGTSQRIALNFSDWRLMLAAAAALIALFTLSFVGYLRRMALQRGAHNDN